MERAAGGINSKAWDLGRWSSGSRSAVAGLSCWRQVSRMPANTLFVRVLLGAVTAAQNQNNCLS